MTPLIDRREALLAAAGLLTAPAWAHHGWSSFDQGRPLYLEGRARSVAWRNPHAELELELAKPLKIPADLAQRPVPAQSSPVDGPRLLKDAQVPKRQDPVWEIELAPLTRMQAWQVDEIKPGTQLAVLGFTLHNEQGEAVLRAEYLWVAGKTYALRSSPA
jgi:Family of unknown function (DUF6152)